VRLAAIPPRLPARQARLMEAVLAEIDAQYLGFPSADQLAERLGTPPQAIVHILALAESLGRAHPLTAQTWTTPAVLARLAEDCARLAGPGWGARELRTRLGVPRPLIPALLEWLE
jgi:hypothetical protein